MKSLAEKFMQPEVVAETTGTTETGGIGLFDKFKSTTGKTGTASKWNQLEIIDKLGVLPNDGTLVFDVVVKLLFMAYEAEYMERGELPISDVWDAILKNKAAKNEKWNKLVSTANEFGIDAEMIVNSVIDSGVGQLAKRNAVIYFTMLDSQITQLKLAKNGNYFVKAKILAGNGSINKETQYRKAFLFFPPGIATKLNLQSMTLMQANTIRYILVVADKPYKSKASTWNRGPQDTIHYESNSVSAVWAVRVD